MPPVSPPEARSGLGDGTVTSASRLPLGWLARRLAMMAATLLAIITLTFALMHAVPGGPFVSEKMLAPEIEAALNAKFGLDQPIWRQYLNYLGGVLTFDLGPSFKYPGVSVNSMIADGLAVTAQTGLLAVIVVVALGVPAGVIAALNRGRWPDTLAMFLASLGIAVPSYVIATVSLYVLPCGWAGCRPSALMTGAAISFRWSPFPGSGCLSLRG